MRSARSQYSVCPAGSTLDEACFNAHVLPFIGRNTTIRYLDGHGHKIIPALDVDEGKKTPLFASFYTKNYHFTKTGSGQT